MPEYCVECWNEINKCSLTEDDIELSKETEVCGECRKRKNVIVKFKNWKFLKKKVSTY